MKNDTKQARRDLRLVLGAINMDGLVSLSYAMERNQVISGRFIDVSGGGCLFHWLSCCKIIDRQDKNEWAMNQVLWSDEHTAAMNRLIVGWDQNGSIVKGQNYESKYPKASYKLSRRMVSQELKRAIAERNEVNRLEFNSQNAVKLLTLETN